MLRELAGFVDDEDHCATEFLGGDAEEDRLAAVLLPSERQAADPEPTRFQVAELPEMTAVVTEHQGHARTCRECGEVTRAAIPAEVRLHSCGPRLTAALAYLAGTHQVSKRGLEEICSDLFDAPIALGTVSNREGEVCRALAASHQQALDAVRDAPVKHVDETGGKQAGKTCWLWRAATPTVAAFLIHPRRSLAALTALLGEAIHGLVVSDRFGVYHRVPASRRQVCWAHLKRDFQKCLDRGGDSVAVGREGLRIVARVFRLWHDIRGGGLDRDELQARILPVSRQLDRLLERGRVGADPAVASFCANLAELAEAPWQFAIEEGVEPTNNHAERLLRRGVLWRKNSFGCSSERGCRFVERILTVVQTLRLQKRPVLAFLHETVMAHRAGQSGPALAVG